MMKIINLLLGLLFFINFTFAISFKYFDVQLNKPYQSGSVFTITPKDIDRQIVDMNVFINNEKFPRLSSDKKQYLFKIPSNLQPGDKKLKLVANFADKTKKDYIYDLPVPYFISIDATNLTGGGSFRIYGSFTGSCKLHLGDLSLSASSKNGKYFFTMPSTIKNTITNSYVVCDNIASNSKPINILPSPTIYYVVSKNKKVIRPGDDIIILGKYIKLKEHDDIQVLLNGKQLEYTFLNNNKLKVKLPYTNISNASLEVIRNGFKSNTIKITNIVKYPKIYHIAINNKGSNYFFRLYGNFDFSLGGLKVTYAGRTMPVLATGSLNDMQYIDVNFPHGQIDNDGNINCDYELYPSYFYINLGGQKSNGFFYEPSDLSKIINIKVPNCVNGYCSLSLSLNKNPGKINILLNGSKIPSSAIGNRVSLSLGTNFVKKGKIEILNQFCVKTQPYYFDFSNEFIPLIRYVESKNNFIPYGSFVIHGEKLTHDGYHTGMKLNLSFSPDVVDKKTIVYDWNTINGEILSKTKKGEKINISLGNLNGKSNGAYFIIGGSNKYMANPYIKYVTYENGAGVGDKIEIDGINFNEYNCSKDVIYIGNRVIYPDKCDYNKLIFTVPNQVKGNTIFVEVDGVKSNTYTLNSIVGGDKLFTKFDIVPTVSTEKVYLSQSSKVSLNLKLHNPSTDVYLNKLLFKLDFPDAYLPAGDFTLSINGNNKRYYFNSSNYKIIKTDLLNNGKILKKGKSYFIEFNNIYIPYSSNEIPLQIDFNIFKSTDNDSSFDLTLPEQTVYYQNIYKSDNFKRFNLSNKKLATIYVGNKHSTCFDADSTFKNCALVLKGQEVPKQKTTKTNYTQKATSRSDIKDEKSTNKKIEKKTNSHKISKRERIANKLNLKKMKLINNLFKQFIIKLKKKYWGTKKIYYVLEMYKGYKKMEANVSDDFNKKLNYVDGLISFAKAYFSYIKNK